MKIFKKIMVVLFAAAFSLSSFAACAEQGQTGGGGGDPTKTQLKIGVYNGGLGWTWASTLAKKFEEKSPLPWRGLINLLNKYEMAHSA